MEGESVERKPAEDALRQSEQRYRGLVELSPDAIFINRNNQVVMVNPAAVRMFGAAQAEDLLGRSPYDLFHPEYHATMRERITRLLEGTVAPFIEGKILRLDGTVRFAEIAAAPFLDAEGVTAIQVILRDITERKQAEAILTTERDLASQLAAADRLEDIVRISLDAAIRSSGLECGGVYLRDPDSGVLELACHSGLGAEFIDAVTSVPPDAFHSEALRSSQLAEFSRQHLEELGFLPAIREGLSLAAAVPVIHEGRAIACLNLASHTMPAVTPHAHLVLKAVAAQMGEAIARAQAEAALRRSEQRLLIALEATEMGSWVYTFAGQVFECGERARRLYASEARRFRYDERWATDNLHPDDVAAMWSALQAAVATPDGRFHCEYRVRQPGGGWRWLSVWGQVDFEGEGSDRRPVRIIGASRDVTQQKQAGQEKLEMQRQLFHAQKLESLGILAGGIAHDFNNILAGIMGYADLLKRRLPPSAAARDDVEEIRKAVRRAAGLTRQLLAYAGKGRFVLEAVNLSQIIEDMRRMRSRSRPNPTKVALRWQ